ncbi:MAG: tRNA (adenosine(37)-N6)-threonylcarbamoyltransferase complex dimerization subunit type 1 TsaB [Erythrobacter sp.]
MRQLAIECTSEACSIALFEDGALIANTHQELGRGHAERLIPFIAELPDKGKAERILVSLGPGSFTGVRIGIAAARALGFAWEAEVLGYPTLALVAATARSAHPDSPVTSCMNGGHGEWFVQDFGADGLPEGELAAVAVEAAMARSAHPIVAGNRADERCAGSALTPHNILPDARHTPLIPAQLITDDLTPLYGRAPDATLPAKKNE